MKRCDLLQDIFDKKISNSEAEAIVASSLDSEEGANTARLLGFQKTEWTAYSHGAELTEISRWRHSGWPNTCVICHQPIVVENFGWQIVDIEDVACLRHVRCPTI